MTSLPAIALVALLASHAQAVEILFRNECGKQMTLWNGSRADTIQKDDTLLVTVPVEKSEAFRLGTSNQATLAEFSVKSGVTWYDIGIIPTGRTKGPDQCTSLADCKAYTGGTGFNVGMKIIPTKKDGEIYEDTCRTLNCFADGCDDAYQFPEDPGKTRNCPDSVEQFTVVFCATASTSSSSGSVGSDEAGVIASVAPTASIIASSSPTTPTPEPTTQHVSTTASNGGSGGTSVAVIIAAIIGGFVTIFVGVVLSRRLRYMQLERRNNQRRYSSEAMMFVEAKDHGSL